MQDIQDALSVSQRELEAVRHQNHELKQQVMSLNMVLAGSGAGSWDWHVQTGETIMNERWANMIGYTLEEISPTSLDTFKRHCHPEDLQQAFLLIQRMFQKKIK